VITCSTNLTAVCSGTNGAQVTFTVTATDTCDSSPVVTCIPASGSYFSAGTTTVNCTATDASNNHNPCSFTVSVSDTTIAKLTIVQDGTDVLVTWPQTCTQYQLEKSSDLKAWSAAGAVVNVVGSNFQARIPASGDKFLRLKQ